MRKPKGNKCQCIQFGDTFSIVSANDDTDNISSLVWSKTNRRGIDMLYNETSDVLTVSKGYETWVFQTTSQGRVIDCPMGTLESIIQFGKEDSTTHSCNSGTAAKVSFKTTSGSSWSPCSPSLEYTNENVPPNTHIHPANPSPSIRLHAMFAMISGDGSSNLMQVTEILAYGTCRCKNFVNPIADPLVLTNDFEASKIAAFHK
ncbi:hypothetical protein ACA910_001614 [Epithemia clementina (nom. ined.)]